MRVEYLTIEENSLLGRLRCADKEINLVGQIVKPFFQ